jgi:23S rRNA pseudouridine2457 synthase
MLIAFHKPYGVLSQFTRDGSPNRTLAEFGFPKNVYAIGRLDADSEGLLLLSDEPELNERLLHPRHAHEREYWAQVERIPTPEALNKLSRGVTIQGRKTLPCRACLLDPQPQVISSGQTSNIQHPTPNSQGSPLNPSLEVERSLLDVECSPTHGASAGTKEVPLVPPRTPPIRFRKSVPDRWVGLELIEGKNRQVRRMTAAIGHPTLRLLRVRIGNLRLENLPQGKWKELNREERKLVLFSSDAKS